MGDRLPGSMRSNGLEKRISGVVGFSKNADAELDEIAAGFHRIIAKRLLELFRRAGHATGHTTAMSASLNAKSRTVGSDLLNHGP